MGLNRQCLIFRMECLPLRQIFPFFKYLITHPIYLPNVVRRIIYYAKFSTNREIGELFGFSPVDASPGFKKWKENFLKGTGIISEGKEFEALKKELQNDGFLNRFLTPEEIDDLLRKHYESQQTGKRKLANIKARIILDKTQNLVAEAETLDMKAKEKLYQLR